MFDNNTNTFDKKILFVGIPDMAYICLDGLKSAGVNIVGVIGPKKSHPTYLDFKRFVKHLQLNYIEYEQLDDVFFIEKIRNLEADLAVVCSFNYKIPKVLLNSVKGGFVNVHPSLLPYYRGPNPYSIAIINDDKETGVTLHFMDEKFDTGDIILQKKLALSPLETMGTLFNRTNILAFDMLMEILRNNEKGSLNRIKQPEGDFPRGEILQEEELYVDFGISAKKIESFVRALNPFILARTKFRGTEIKILTAEAHQYKISEGLEVGSIAKIDQDNFYITTSDGLLSITSMQFGSFFAGTSKEFINLLNPKIGEIFS